MNQPQFIIQKVLAADKGVLRLVFADGFDAVVDLHEVISKHPTLAELNNPAVFNQVMPDKWSRGVIFAGDDNLTLASDNLRALAIEQAGGYSHQEVIAWMHHHGLSLDNAAEALGISRRMLADYRSGERSIPKTVGLAMLGREPLSSGQHLDAYGKVA